MSVNQKLLEAIRSRKSRRAEFGYGICTADNYVNRLKSEVGLELCYQIACQHWLTPPISFNDVLEKASKTLVYANPDLEATRIKFWKEVEGSVPQSEYPKNTLMAFQHILTTPRKDRDGDVLRTEGAIVDPKLPLLWQHVHTLPIGKMVEIVEHNSNKLSLVSVIVDMNQLSHDAAVMIDSGMGRFSHGFRALEFEELKEQEGETTSPGGFDIKRFEIMEASLVSVPSNVDAETEDVLLGLVEGNKLKSKFMKEYGKSLRDRRSPTVSVKYRERIGDYERDIEAPNAATFEEIYKTTNGETKDEDRREFGKEEGREQGREDKARPSEERDGTSEETKEASHQEGLKGAPIQGSWEWIERQLYSQAERYLSLHNVNLNERFVWVLGTFADYVVICAEHYSSGVEDEYLYYQVSWEMDGDQPRLVGTPQEVSIVTTLETRERSPLFRFKEDWVSGEKAGRAMSRRNLETLKEVYEDLKELHDREEMTRGGSALCSRCVTKLADLIAEVEGEPEETNTEPIEKEFTVKEAVSLIIRQASLEERNNLTRILETFQTLEDSESKAKQFTAMVSGG